MNKIPFFFFFLFFWKFPDPETSVAQGRTFACSGARRRLIEMAAPEEEEEEEEEVVEATDGKVLDMKTECKCAVSN